MVLAFDDEGSGGVGGHEDVGLEAGPGGVGGQGAGRVSRARGGEFPQPKALGHGDGDGHATGLETRGRIDPLVFDVPPWSEAWRPVKGSEALAEGERRARRQDLPVSPQVGCAVAETLRGHRRTIERVADEEGATRRREVPRPVGPELLSGEGALEVRQHARVIPGGSTGGLGSKDDFGDLGGGHRRAEECGDEEGRA